jgi:Lrp/AsnC family transcriptional regulator for asnA, asnC and gidA
MIILRFTLLGMKQHKIYFCFENFTKEAEKEILDYCIKHPQIIWVASCVGTYDLLIATLTKTVKEFLAIKSELLKQFQNYIADYTVSTMAEALTYRRNYLVNKKEHLPEEAWLDRADDQEIPVDEVDLAILKQLAKNGRMPATEIAKNINSTPRQVAYRINQLEKKGIIQGCKISLNYQKLGLHFFKCFIKLKNPPEERIRQFANYCRNNPNIIHYVRTVGSWDLEPEFEVGSQEQFYGLLREMRSIFADIIKTINTIWITEEHKFTYFAEE